MSSERRMSTVGSPRFAVLVILAITAGCADDTRGTPPTTTRALSVVRTTIPIPTTTLGDLTASNGLAASIRQFREDEALDVIQIELVRESSPDAGPRSSGPNDLLGVKSVRLDWPGFAPVPATERVVQIAPGQRVDLPTPIGAIVCETDEPPSFALGTVETVIARSDGTSSPVRAPLLADAQNALDNIWSKGCIRQRLLTKVGLEWAPWTRSDSDALPTATGRLVVTRGATTEPISVAGVDGSVLLIVTPAATLTEKPATMRPTERRLDVPVEVTGSGRCDGHALGDSKKTYEFQVRVSVGDDEPIGVNVSVPVDARPVLTDIIADTCADNRHR